MQNVVDVACSSPPVAMNATKPAIQVMPAADQDPFGLVLQRASEKIVNDRQSDNASRSSESKSAESKHGSNSTANNKVSESKNEREVVKTAKSEKSDQSEKAEKTDESAEDEKSKKKDNANNSENMVYGYAAPITNVDDYSQQVGQVNMDETNGVDGETVQPANGLMGNLGLQSQSEVGDSDASALGAQAATVSENAAADEVAAANSGIAESGSDTENQISYSEMLNKNAKVDEKTTTDLKQVPDETEGKAAETGKVNVNTSTNNQGETVISISQKNQEAISSAAGLNDKALKPDGTEGNQQTAPPDNPNGATVTAAGAAGAVQTTSQISEPARLAEAPKNEVISQVANQIDQMVKTNRSSVRMQLYPEELGHIELRIVTTKDGIGVTMVADKASTQQALKSEMESLRQSIEQAGIQLTNLNINQGQNSNRQQSFEHRQNFSNASYPGNNSDNPGSTAKESKKHLISTVVDYKV